MALNKYRVGDLIEIIDERNSFRITNFCGININKEFMPTAANTDGLDESKYKVVRRNRFVFSGMQTGRDQCIRISMYVNEEPIIVSPAYTTFEIKRHDLVIPCYFFMFFKSSEKDRLGAFYSDGSIRSNLDWDRFCDIKIELPDLPTQEKYVKVYLSMLENQKNYERGLDDLKLVCDGYIEELRRKMPCEEISPHLRIRREQNVYLKFNDEDVLGVSQTKEIIETKSDTKGDDISKFTVIHPDDFVYNPRNGIAVGLNKKDAIISWNNTAFYISDNTIIPEYLMMWLSRKEWDRKVKVDSWGSSTEVYSFESLGSTQIPIPNKNIQQSIVDIYKCYQKRKEINEKLKQQIKDICPILIKGSIEEAREA